MFLFFATEPKARTCPFLVRAMKRTVCIFLVFCKETTKRIMVKSSQCQKATIENLFSIHRSDLMSVSDGATSLWSLVHVEMQEVIEPQLKIPPPN